MSKHKRNMIASVVLMVIAVVLAVRAFLVSSDVKIGDIASQLGLFLLGVYLFYLNYKNEQKMEKEVNKNKEIIKGQ